MAEQTSPELTIRDAEGAAMAEQASRKPTIRDAAEVLRGWLHWTARAS